MTMERSERANEIIKKLLLHDLYENRYRKSSDELFNKVDKHAALSRYKQEHPESSACKYSRYSDLPQKQRKQVNKYIRTVCVPELIMDQQEIDPEQEIPKPLSDKEQWRLRQELASEYNNRSILNQKEIDIVLEQYKIGIEINPTATHNVDFSIFGNCVLEVDYHKAKSDLADASGYHLIHLFDWYSVNRLRQRIISRLSNSAKEQKTYLQKCSIDEANNFIEQNSIDMTARANPNNQYYSLVRENVPTLYCESYYRQQTMFIYNIIPSLSSVTFKQDFEQLLAFLSNSKNDNIAYIKIVANRDLYDKQLYFSLGFSIECYMEPICFHCSRNSSDDYVMPFYIGEYFTDSEKYKSFRVYNSGTVLLSKKL